MGISSQFLLSIVRRLLDGEEVSSVEAARKAPVKPAAVRFMLNEIAESLGGHVLVHGRRSRRYRLRRPTDAAADPYEAVALALARELAVFLKDSLLDQHLQNAASTAVARLAPETGAVPDLSRMIVAKTRLGAPQGVRSEIVDIIVQCLIERRIMKGTYRQFDGSEQSVTIRGYSLILAEEGLYVFGRCVDSEKTQHVDTERIYNVARFSMLRAGIDRYIYPSLSDYNPIVRFEHCWGIFVPAEGEEVVEARIAFDSKFAHFLSEHRFHRHQSAPRALADGRLEVTFKVYLTQDFIRFLRGFGGHQAAPLAPERLVAWYRDGRDPHHPERVA